MIEPQAPVKLLDQPVREGRFYDGNQRSDADLFRQGTSGYDEAFTHLHDVKVSLFQSPQNAIEDSGFH